MGFRMKHLGVLVIVSMLAAPAWAASAESELLQADREWAAAAASGDLETVFSFWADDAEIYAPGLPPAIGIEQIRRYVEQRRALPDSSISWEPQVAVVSESGDLGYTRGPYEMTLPTPGGEARTVRGNYVSLWRRDEKKRWKCILEIHSPLP